MRLGAVKAEDGALRVKVLLQRLDVNAVVLADVAVALGNGDNLRAALLLEEERRVVADCGGREVRRE